MNTTKKIILASKSPRRQQLLRDLGYNFTVHTKDIDESFPENLKAAQIPLYLCELKANSFVDELKDEHTIVITADTVVWINDGVLNKPENFADAVRMLHLLSGKTHEVFTGVCLKSKTKTHTFFCTTKVRFRELKREQIQNYVLNCKPFDKAGSYGAQECLPPGMNPCSKAEIEFLRSQNRLDLIDKSIVKVSAVNHDVYLDSLDGSYFNVMGLPLIELHQSIKEFF